MCVCVPTTTTRNDSNRANHAAHYPSVRTTIATRNPYTSSGQMINTVYSLDK